MSLSQSGRNLPQRPYSRLALSSHWEELGHLPLPKPLLTREMNDNDWFRFICIEIGAAPIIAKSLLPMYKCQSALPNMEAKWISLPMNENSFMRK